jgi:hypothetical protein
MVRLFLDLSQYLLILLSILLYPATDTGLQKEKQATNSRRYVQKVELCNPTTKLPPHCTPAPCIVVSDSYVTILGQTSHTDRSINMWDAYPPGRLSLQNMSH